MAEHVTIRLGINSYIKAGQGNPTVEKGSPNQAKEAETQIPQLSLLGVLQEYQVTQP